MSLHSCSRCWLHLIWGTLNREKVLQKRSAARVSLYLTQYAQTKGLYMKINYVNADHVHALADLKLTDIQLLAHFQAFHGIQTKFFKKLETAFKPVFFKMPT